MEASTGTWEHVGTSYGEEHFLVEGIDLFAHDWAPVIGAHAAIRDPVYGQPFDFPVYRVSAEGLSIEFAAGEFSNAVWGFFRQRLR